MPETLAELIREHAATGGDRIAFTFVDTDHTTTDLTYAELDERSSRVAQGLVAAGIGTGDRIAFLDKNTPELFVALFGAVKVGAVLVAVNWRLAPSEIAYIVNDARAKLLIVGPEFTSVVDTVADQLGTVSTILVLDEGKGHTGKDGDSHHETWSTWVSRHPATDPNLPTDAGDVAVQFYTSGTTGLPKGAMLSHHNLFAITPLQSEVLRFTPDAVNLVTMPLFHIAGTGWGLLGLYHGVHNVMLRDVDLTQILDVIGRYGITHAVLVPAVMQFLLVTPGIEDADFSSLRLLVYGASPISEEVLVGCLERFGCDFMQVYGLTETNGGIVQLPPADHDPRGPNRHRLRAAGIPFPGVELRIVDSEGNECPTGDVGEIWIKSPSNLVGYWNLPEATAAALTPDGWFRSGDAGYLDADGYLYIADRVNDMIISGGENVYPAEVESVLMSHPAVADVAVIGVPDERWGETPKALVVRAPGAAPGEHEIIEWCRQRLAHYKCPTSVDWIEVLPRNPSGKILKRELREPYWAGRDRQVS